MLKVEYKGLDNLMARLKAAPENIVQKVGAEVQSAAFMFRDGAKRDLANQGGDRGTLLKSIAANPVDALSFKVSAVVFYAPYVEFGTKKKVRIEPGFEEAAAEAKGLPQRGGQLKFFETIKQWVRRKGISSGKDLDHVSFLISRSILINGISPKPFFFKQFTPVRNKLITRLEKVVKESGI